MQLGMIGLGRMGANMVRRLMKDGHQCVVFDMFPKAVEALVAEKATGASSCRTSWQAREAAQRVAHGARGRRRLDYPLARAAARAGDTIIDGGNSYYIDDIRRSSELAPKKIDYVDVGTSGGVWGLERGYCMMIGGPDATVQRLDPVFKTLAPGRGDIERTPGARKSAARPSSATCTAGRAGRALREDGAQRHRVRDHGRVRGGPGHPQVGERRQADARDRRRDDTPARSRALPIRHRPRRTWRKCGGAAA
jgi:6-phosphogluconate dehydrogenase (decarboxylating)